MKTASLFLRAALFGAALVSVSRAANTFEGRVQVTTTSAASPTPRLISYSIKGDKMRFEMPGQAGFGMLIDFTKSESLMLMERGNQKTFMRRPLAEAEAAVAAASKASTAQPVATGKTDTIAGYRATEYKVTDANGSTELWLTSELGRFTFPSMSNPMGRGRGADDAAPGWVAITRAKNEFPCA